MPFAKTNTITNGTVADGSKVEQNFNDILSGLNSGEGLMSGVNLVDATIATAKVIPLNITAALLAADINTKILTAGAVYGLTDGATIALSWVNGTTQKATLGGNRTFTFANPVAGQVYRLMIIQDGTGSRTLTWPTIKWQGGTAPTLSSVAAKTDIITLLYDGTSYYGSASINF